VRPTECQASGRLHRVLTDTWATSQLKAYYDVLCLDMDRRSEPLPQNRPAGDDDFDLVLRDLDCAVLNLALRTFDDRAGDNDRGFQTVRGVFVEGDPVYDGARIHTKTHVQIAVRDRSCILGYFRPSGGYTLQ